MIRSLALGTVLMLVAACSSSVAPLPATPASPATSVVAINGHRLGGAIQVRLAASAFHVQAAPKTAADIDHYVITLYDSTDTEIYSHTTADASASTVTFTSVPDGTYYITGEAFDSAASITQGGAQRSTNDVTVASPDVTYSQGSALTATLQLLDGTGETFDSSLSVTPGKAYTGPITVAP